MAIQFVEKISWAYIDLFKGSVWKTKVSFLLMISQQKCYRFKIFHWNLVPISFLKFWFLEQSFLNWDSFFNSSFLYRDLSELQRSVKFRMILWGHRFFQAIYDVKTSSKKWTKLTILSKENGHDSKIRSFFGRSFDTINYFWYLLTVKNSFSCFVQFCFGLVWSSRW